MSDLSGFFNQAAFDVNSVEPQGDFEVIPPGKYTVLIEKSELQQTKKGNGHFIYLEMQIADGQFKGRKIFDRINVENPSSQCIVIGKRCLSALGLAIGLQAVSDTSQLVNQLVIAHVKIKNEQNEVRTYSSVGSAVQEVVQAQAQAPVAIVQGPIVQGPVAQGPVVQTPVGQPGYCVAGEAPVKAAAPWQQPR